MGVPESFVEEVGVIQYSFVAFCHYSCARNVL